MHSVTLAQFVGPPPSLHELTEHVATRVSLVPRFRQRVEEIPFELGRPMWVDDPAFSIENHVVENPVVENPVVEIPVVETSPDREADGPHRLDHLVSRIVSEQLDRSRPLWQLNIVTGLDDDRWALISKVHHSMIDGVFGTEPLAVLIDGAAGDGASSSSWTPKPVPSREELFGLTVAELTFNPIEQYRFGRSRARRAKRRFDALTGRSSEAIEHDQTGLRGAVGAERTWSSLTIDMAEIRAVRSGLDANTHELILAVITAALRDLLIARDPDSIGDLSTVRAIVPVAVASSGSGFRGGVAAEVVDLPVGEDSMLNRIDRLHDQASEATSNPVAIDAQIGVSGFPTAALASLGLREATRRGAAERNAQTVIVNVPGPRQQLTVLGRPATEISSAPPLAAGVRLGFGVFSYLDKLTFGVTTDRRSVPDADVVVAGLRNAVAQLIDRAGD